jgi:hypothetical protein
LAKDKVVEVKGQIQVKGQIHQNDPIFTKFCTHVYPRIATPVSDLAKVKVIEVKGQIEFKFTKNDPICTKF